jgi:peptidoglycan/xylan/chitin deacetylase (PgdA/CDA1 family)
LATAALLRNRQVPGTFFVVSQIVQDDAELARALVGAGEASSQTADHTPLAGLTAQDQSLRLGRSWTDIEEWTGVAPAGLHPPEETFDASTLDALQRVGGTYLLATNEARSASPEIHRVRGTSMVLLPRILKDDYNIIVQDRVLRGASLGQALQAGTRKMRAIGGLAVVAGHTQIIREGPRLDALEAVADSALAQGDWWIARGSEVAAWWSSRAGTTVEFEPLSERASEAPVSDLLVTAPLDRSVQNL